VTSANRGATLMTEGDVNIAHFMASRMLANAGCGARSLLRLPRRPRVARQALNTMSADAPKHDKLSLPADYVRPDVWEPRVVPGGAMGAMNSPTAGRADVVYVAFPPSLQCSPSLQHWTRTTCWTSY
jgi:hypothetical protein